MKSLIIKLSEIGDINDCALAYGHFDTIHPGHVRYLKYAKSIGKKLIVAIMGDSKKHDYPSFKFNQKERSETLAMLDIADIIICLKEEELSEVVKKIKPKALVLGKEKESPNNVDYQTRKAINLQIQLGGIVEFKAGEVNYSSAEVLYKSEGEILEKRKEEFRLA